MNPPTPTPRTDAAVKLTFAAGHNTVCPNFARTLESELAAAKAECERLRPHSLSAGEREDYHDALTELTRLRAEVERLKFYIATTIQPEEHAKVIKDLRALSDQLSDNLSAVGAAYNTEKARAEKAEAAFADPHTLHAHCLRTLTEGQIAHLFGERMTEIVNRAEKAEAELITEQTRLDYLGLHMGTRMVAEALNCDYGKCFPIRDAIDAAMKKEDK